MAIKIRGFKEDTDPIDDMEIGMRDSINRILDENGNCLNHCRGDIYKNTNINGWVIEINGNLVLKSRRYSELIKELQVTNIILKPLKDSNVTILDELKPDKLYNRIIGYYKNFIILNPENQKERIAKTAILENFNWSYILKKINNSNNYITNLSSQPNDLQMKDLSKQVFCENQILFYGCELKDDFSVQMGVYALELGKLVYGTQNFCQIP